MPTPVMGNTVGEVSGMYAATVDGSEWVLKLWHNSQGFVSGSYSSEGETLEVRGGFSAKTAAMQGYLLEPFGMLPVAMLSAQQTAEGLSVEIGVLEFDSLLESAKPAQIRFSRVWNMQHQAEEAHEELEIGAYA